MAAPEQENQEAVQFEQNNQQAQETAQPNDQQEYVPVEETADQKEEQENSATKSDYGEDRSGFIHGLAVGLGIACIATFVIMWLAVFFTPRLPQALTYENLLAIFIYPLIYLLAVGLTALTAGIVREYYSYRRKP